MLNAGVKRQIAVVGLGYAGLPLALAFSQHNRVVGYDTDESRIEELKRAFDRNRALSRSAISASSLKVTAAIDDVSECDFYIIVVPTPVTATKKPDLDHLIDATTAVGRRLKKGDIVVYESTVYPGATEDLCIPILERESNLKSPTDFAVGYSPERVSCGDTDLSLHNTVKVISAQTAEALEIIHTVYSTTIEAGLWRAPNIRVAEAAKLLENTQRDVNIALMNECATIFDALGICTKDVLQAAETKHNFARFKPGLVGGHCISVDPYYLLQKAQEAGCEATLIPMSRTINDAMPSFVVGRTIALMREHNPDIVNAKIGVLGLTFKENISDLRESRSSDIVFELKRHGLQPLVHDPLAQPDEASNLYGIGLQEWKSLRELSAVIVTVAHDAFRQLEAAHFREILVPGGLVVDVKALFDATMFAGTGLRFWQL